MISFSYFILIIITKISISIVKTKRKNNKTAFYADLKCKNKKYSIKICIFKWRLLNYCQAFVCLHWPGG